MKANKTLLPILFIFGLISFPLSTKANETFSPTVKVIAYHQFLNGQLSIAGYGSGTIISKDGQVLTNAHLIYNTNLQRPFDAFSVCVSESSQEEPDCRFTATLERYDEKIDLAVLSIDETAVWGTTPSSFPFLTHRHGIKPESGDGVAVRGFPANGGATISVTKGQVSGFDTYNGYSYLKTDADIDAGNSGGTMLDSDGNFIGVPSYVVSYYENSGRSLHVDEVVKWMTSSLGEKGTFNASATNKVREEWIVYNNASNSKKFTFKSYPGLSFEMPQGWIFGLTSGSGALMMKEDNQSAVIQVAISSNGFDFDMSLEDRLDILNSSLEDETLDGDEVIELGNEKTVEALHVWRDLPDGSVHTITFSYGYKDILISYTVPKSEKSVVTRGVDSFLESLTFSESQQDDPSPSHRLDVDGYPFALETPSAWRIITDHMTENNLAVAAYNTKKLQNLNIYYAATGGGEIDFTTKEGLEVDIEEYLPENGKVTSKSHSLKVDGLPGWIYIYDDKEGDIKMKGVSVTILDPEYELYFDMRAEADIFDEQMELFEKTLKSFKSRRYDGAWGEDWDDIFDAKEQGKYNIPFPGSDNDSSLTDIGGHRYRTSIENLVDIDVIGGYPDGSFKPENPVNRAEALKIILQSLRAKQSEEGGESFVMPEGWSKFSDLKPDEWYATYVAEGMDKGIIGGYPDGTFRGGNTVNLAEALKMALEAHNAEVWEGNSDPWHKKYFDAAQALDLLPKDLTDPAKLLTRAELAYIVDELLNAE